MSLGLGLQCWLTHLILVNVWAERNINIYPMDAQSHSFVEGEIGLDLLHCLCRD